jgi:hypothetical protein
MMENGHSWRLRRFPGVSDMCDMDYGKGYFCCYPVRDQRSYGVYVNQDNNLPILWRFSTCPTPSFLQRQC